MTTLDPTKEPADIFARLIGLNELSLAVAPDHELGVVTIDVAGLPGAYQAILARNPCSGPGQPAHARFARAQAVRPASRRAAEQHVLREVGT
jgi:hypothetical protein